MKTEVEKESKKVHADQYLKVDEIFVKMKNEVKSLNLEFFVFMLAPS